MLRLIVGGRASWTSRYTRSMYQRSFFVTSETNFRSVTFSNFNENRAAATRRQLYRTLSNQPRRISKLSGPSNRVRDSTNVTVAVNFSN